METLYYAWGISAAVLVLVGILVGKDAAGGGLFAILVDSRGRFSLAKLQITVWTVVIVSLIVALFTARWIGGIKNALGFSIPDELLIVLGISVGSAATSTAIKSSKDRKYPDSVAASDASDPPHLNQIFLQEEGDYADEVVDIAKFQNFWFTIIAVVAYTLLAIRAIEGSPTVASITLPTFNDTLLTLLGISHAGYIAGKLPAPSGPAPGLTLQKRRIGAIAIASGAAPPAGVPAESTFVPRNRS
jgi:hypothetical protein